MLLYQIRLGLKLDEEDQIMEEFNKIDEMELDNITGGAATRDSGYRTVYNLKKGYLALRTRPYYSEQNEIKGAELYNGYKVRIINFTLIKSSDGHQYYQVYVPKFRKSGYVNAAFLRR